MYIDATTFWIVVIAVVGIAIAVYYQLKHKITYLGLGVSHLYSLVFAICEDAKIELPDEAKELFKKLSKFFENFGDKYTPAPDKNAPNN